MIDAIRAGTLGLPIALAIIGGMPERFAPFAELHREAARAAGHGPATLPLSINSHGYIADTSQRAADESFGPFAATMDKIGRERGWPAMSRQAFEASRTLRGANFVGSPQEVIEKTLGFRDYVGDYQRQLFLVDHAGLPPKTVLEQLDLLGEEVVPVLRKEFAALKPAHVPDAPTHASLKAASAVTGVPA